MTPQEFFQQLDARIARFDLLCHPFYKAWSAGELSRDDLREYSRDYYHHVNAFPSYLAELSMRLAEGMGASRNLRGHEPVAEIHDLTTFFHGVASEGTPEEALAAFYAYESQVPRVAAEKARGLREMYAADDKTCEYFTLHSIADVHHSQIWRQQLARRLEQNPQAAEPALIAAGDAAKALWSALDGIEARRVAKTKAA